MLLSLALFSCLLLMAFHFLKKVKGKHLGIQSNRGIIQSFYRLLGISLLLIELVVYLITNVGMSYTNVQHTAVKLNGLEFNHKINYASVGNPQMSFSTIESGNIDIEASDKKFILKYSSLSLPLLLTDDEGTQQVLSNNLLPQAITKDLLIISKEGDTLLNLSIEDGTYTFKYPGSRGHSSKFKGGIQNQLPVNQLLKTGETDTSQTYLNGSFKATTLLENSRLIYSAANKNLPKGLYLFPGSNLQYQSHDLQIFIDGKLEPTTTDTTALQGSEVLDVGRQFYVLQDATSRLNRIHLGHGRAKEDLLMFTNPIRLTLPSGAKNSTVHCRITTSFDTILTSSGKLFLQPLRFPGGSPFMVSADLSYVVDEGQKPVKIGGVSGTIKLPGSQSISYLLPAANKDFQWIVTAEDFIRESGFSFWLHIALPGLLFFLLCWLLLSPFWIDDGYALKGKNKSVLIVWLYPYLKKIQPLSQSTRFNPAWCYILWTLGVLLPVRYLLQWRMAGFPPLQAQSVNEFSQLTSYFKRGSFLIEQSFVLLFFGALFAIIRNKHSCWWGNLKIKRSTKALGLSLVFGVCTIAFGLWLAPTLPKHGFKGSIGRFFNLCVPLIAFFAIIQSMLYLRLSLLRNGKPGKEKIFSQWHHHVIFKWAGIKNFWYWFLTIITLLTIWCLSLFKNEKSFLLLLGLSLGIWILLSGFKKKKKALMFGVTLVLFGTVISIISIPLFSNTRLGFSVFSDLDKAKQTLCRLQLLVEDRDSLLINNPAYALDDPLFIKLIETSKNQYIINNYQSYKAGWMNNRVWGINIKPHTNYNGDYGTQASDLAGLRYVSAEYGWLCLVAIVLLLMAPLIARLLLVYDPNNDNTYLRFFRPGALIYQRDMFYLLVVALVGIMVALSSSNLFVFMGLDLPVVGFNSKIALMFPLVAFGLFASSFSFETEEISEPLARRTRESPAARQVFAIASFAAFLTLLLVAVNVGWIRNFRYKNKTAGPFYSLENFARQVRKEMDQLTTLLTAAQFQVPVNGTSLLTDKMLMEAVLLKLDSVGQNVSPLTNFAIRHARRICSNPSLWYNADDEFVRAEKASYLDSSTGRVKEYFKFSVNTKPFNLSNGLAESDNRARPDIIAPGDDSLHHILLAKAVNINGSFKYVYPQKNRFPLIYDLVSDMQLDTSLFHNNDPVILSIDLALDDTLRSILDRNRTFTKGDINQYEPLLVFARLPYSKKISRNNGTGIYWDPHTLSFEGKNSGLAAGILNSWWANKLESLYTTGQAYQVNGWLTGMVSDYVDSLCTPVFVNVMEASGSIHSLFAYNTSYGYDPNDISEFDQSEEEIKKYNTNELMIENNLRVHPCLQKLIHGPGSSLKPIIYDAMMDQCNIDWGNISVQNNYTSYITRIYLNQYAGLKLPTGKSGWAVDRPLGVFREYTGPDPVEPSDYLAYSSNLYHSFMLFLGGYTKNQLLTQKNTLGLDSNSTNSPFPKILYAGRTLYLRPEAWPHFGDTTSLLMSVLHSLFGFTINGLVSKDLVYGNYENIYGPPPAVDEGLLNNRMDMFKTYIWTATSGGNPFNISSLQMTIMGTKLFTQNQALHPSYIMRNTDTIDYYQPFAPDISYTGGFAQYKAKVDSLIFTPLSAKIFEKGTLSQLKRLLLKDGIPDRLPLEIEINEGKKLILYAKTGTANVVSSRGQNRSSSDKLLLGCFSDGSLAGVKKTTPRLITFFIDQIEGGGRSEDVLRKEIIMAIAHSKQTQQYFKRR